MIYEEGRIPLDVIVEMFRRLPDTEVRVRVIVDTTTEILPLVQSVADYVERRCKSIDVETQPQSLHKGLRDFMGR